MAALNVEQYKKQIAGAVTRWSRKIADHADMIEKINKQIARLAEQLECATKEGEKKFQAEIDEYKKARQKVVKQIEAADISLRVELMMIEPPEKTKSNEKEFLKLPGFIGKLVEDEGIALGKTGVILKPDVEFDFKKGKLDKFGIELKIKW
jgi:DNA-binding protein H-NS